MIREMDILGMLIPVAMVIGVGIAIVAYQNLDRHTATMGIMGGGFVVFISIIGYELILRRKRSKVLKELKKE